MASQRLAFLDYVLEPSEHSPDPALYKESRLVDLGTNEARALQCLLRAGTGKLVSHAELSLYIWAETVPKSRLHKTISDLKEALGEHRDVIVNVPNRGYYIAASVHQLDEAPAPDRARQVGEAAVGGAGAEPHAESRSPSEPTVAATGGPLGSAAPSDSDMSTPAKSGPVVSPGDGVSVAIASVITRVREDPGDRPTEDPVSRDKPAAVQRDAEYDSPVVRFLDGQERRVRCTFQIQPVLELLPALVATYGSRDKAVQAAIVCLKGILREELSKFAVAAVEQDFGTVRDTILRVARSELRQKCYLDVRDFILQDLESTV
jgi:DNA-binding winged helix-turn-helix (wHTH) protein